MPSAFREKLEKDRQRAGLSVARLSWILGVSVPEYRELVEGVAVVCGLGADRGVLRVAAAVHGGSSFVNGSSWVLAASAVALLGGAFFYRVVPRRAKPNEAAAAGLRGYGLEYLITGVILLAVGLVAKLVGK